MLKRNFLFHKAEIWYRIICKKAMKVLYIAQIVSSSMENFGDFYISLSNAILAKIIIKKQLCVPRDLNLA